MKINMETLKKEVFANIKKSVYKRIFFLAVMFGIMEVLLYLDNSGRIAIPSNFLKFFDVIIFSLLIVILMSIILRLTVSKVFQFQEQETEIEQRIFITKIYTIFLYFLALSAILWKMGVSISNIALVIGIAATGIAFAIREVILAFFVWLVILTKNPFRINDVIRIGDDLGVVSRIGTFYVTLETGKGSDPFIKVPNRVFFEKSVINMGKKMTHQVIIPLKKVSKDFRKQMDIIREYIDSIAQDTKLQIIYEGINPMIKISFVLPFNDCDKTNDILIGINQKLKKEIKT